jgi:hypothetical protein
MGYIVALFNHVIELILALVKDVFEVLTIDRLIPGRAQTGRDHIAQL